MLTTKYKQLRLRENLRSLREWLLRDEDNRRLLYTLEPHGNIAIFGGAVRDFLLHGLTASPRDLDIVVSTDLPLEIVIHEFPFRRNRFGGHKLNLQHRTVDIWLLENTWAFTTGLVQHIGPDTLPNTVFLNFDAVVYDWAKQELYADLFLKALETNTLDIVLEENPFPVVNIARAFVFKKRYGLSFSPRLVRYVHNWVQSVNDPVRDLREAMVSHYGSALLSEAELRIYVDQLER
jgi:hypothetical protein